MRKSSLPSEEARVIFEQVWAAPNPEAAYEALSPGEQLAFDRYSQPYETVSETHTEIVSIPPDYTYSASDIQCETQTKYRRKKTWYGLTMATYKSWTQFCYDGTEVLSADFRADGWVSVFWWSWVGHEFTNEHYGAHNVYHKDYAKGNFKNCSAFPPGRCVHWRPSITKMQWNNGSTN